MDHKSLTEKKYEFLVKFTNDIIIVGDVLMNIVESNYKAQEIYGYSREELLKMSIYELYPNEIRAEFTQKLEILKNEFATSFETINKRKNGTLFPVEFSGHQIEIEGKLFFQFIGRDISDRKRVEDELNRVFRLVPDMICVASTDGFFKKVNQAWERILGFTNEELLSVPFANFIHPDDLVTTINGVQSQLSVQSIFSYRNRYRCKNGDYKWFDWVANPSPDGTLLYAAARDITEQKQAEDEREAILGLLTILNSRSDLHNLVHTVISYLKDLTGCEAIGIRLRQDDDYPYFEYEGFAAEFIASEKCLFSMDSDGKPRYDINDKPYLECNCGDVISKRFDETSSCYTSFGSFWCNSLTELIADQLNVDGVIKGRERCYSEGYESVVIIPLHLGGDIFGLMQLNDKRKNQLSLNRILLLEKLGEYIAIAIIQRKSQEELIDSNLSIQKINEELLQSKLKAEESDRLKSAFLANMSHEIRTPMNAIIGFTEILLKPDLASDKKERFAALIKQRSNDLLRIIEDVLDISKIEVGQMKMIESDISLSLLLNEIYEYFRLKIEKMEKKSDLDLKLTLSAELKHVRIKTDSLRLKQILNNLLDNAFKFTQKGSIEFGCSLESGKELQFFVKDTGIGIPANKQKVIFDPFRQAEDLIFTRQYGGVGLGLSIVKGMIGLMRGKIWLHSKVNQGTTFNFTLPYHSSLDVIESIDDVEEAITVSWKDKILLIVEDDEANSMYLNEILSSYELTILNAFNGEEALQLFNDRPDINLVLMDLRLPDTNGLTLTRILKKDKPQIPVIAQTAYTAQEDIDECFAAGCNDYISKPINKRKLISLIDGYFGEG